MTACILVTPPPGFEVSTDNVNFSNTVTAEAAGIITSTTVYLRLTPASPVGSYSGNIVLSSAGATSINVPTATSRVNPAPLTITANNATKTYGKVQTGGTGSTAFTSTGVKNNETIGTVTITYDAGSASNATAKTYSGSITPSAATGGTFTAGNYTITYLPGDIIVNQTQLIITANNQTITLGDPIPLLTATYASFVNGENETDLTTPTEITTTATTTSPPGDYTITVNGASSPNYTITNIPGTLTIKPVNPTITIPNAFTPNSDGINDVWNIKSLSDYPLCTVSIFTRYGTLIYLSRGYPKPWDGTYKGAPLPVGTYYFIIDLKNGSPQLSGYVAVIR
jgi:gliding motility-associated-like protein